MPPRTPKSRNTKTGNESGGEEVKEVYYVSRFLVNEVLETFSFVGVLRTNLWREYKRGVFIDELKDRDKRRNGRGSA